MPKSNVFITGATGFIGAHVALCALKAGYNVKLSVRREAQIESLCRVFDTFANKLDFVVVSDYTAANVFDSALKDIDYVIHVASPLPKPKEDLLTPAVKGTTSILESASRTPTVKKVVITASVLSFVPLGKGGDSITVKAPEDIPKEDLYFDHSIVPTLEPMGQYQASKLAAHTATLDYISDHNPKYSVVTIHPVFVFGENLLQTTAEELGGTNGMIFGSLYSKEPMFAPYRGVHVLDVAEARIRALTLDDAPIASFLLAGKDRSWEEVLEFAKKEFPEAGFQTQPETGDRWFVDTTRAEAHLGFAEWRDMEEQVRDVVLQQLKLRSGWDSSRVNLYCECWRKLLQNISAGICHGEQAVNEQKLCINIH